MNPNSAFAHCSPPVCLLAMACGGDGGRSDRSIAGHGMSSVSVAYPEDHGTIYIGDEVQFQAMTSSSGSGTQAATNATWESDAPAVVTVSLVGPGDRRLGRRGDDIRQRFRPAGAARYASGSSRSSMDIGRVT